MLLLNDCPPLFLTQQKSHESNSLLGTPNLDSHLAGSHCWAVSQPSLQTSVCKLHNLFEESASSGGRQPARDCAKAILWSRHKACPGFCKVLLLACNCL